VSDHTRSDSERSIGRLLPLFAAHVVGTANITLVIALSPAIEQALSIGHAAFGLMVSAFYGSMLILAIPAGWLVDRFGLRAMLITAHALLALGMAILATASAFATATFALFVCGCGYAIINPSTARAVLTWFPHRLRATAMGIKQTGVPAGGVVAAGVAAAAFADWRVVTLGMAVSTAVIGACYVGLRVPPHSAGSAIRFSDIAALLRNRQLGLFNAASLLYAIGQAAFFAYLVLYAREVVGTTIGVASLCLAIAHVASAAGRIFWGVVSDRIVRDGRMTCLTMVGVLAALGILLLAGASSLGAAVLLITCAVVGFTMGGYAGITQAATVEAVEPQRAGAAIGYNLLLLSLGTMLGPAAFGASVETLGYPGAWAALAAVALVGATLYRASTIAARTPAGAHSGRMP
jgi:predicted MFS family arabinose efflux permease